MIATIVVLATVELSTARRSIASAMGVGVAAFVALQLGLRRRGSNQPTNPNMTALARNPPPTTSGDLVITCDLDLFDQHLSLVSTLTTFGSLLDVTLDELLIGLFFPADTPSEDVLKLMHA